MGKCLCYKSKIKKNYLWYYNSVKTVMYMHKLEDNKNNENTYLLVGKTGTDFC